MMFVDVIEQQQKRMFEHGQSVAVELNIFELYS